MHVWVLSQLVGSPGTERFLRAVDRAGHRATLLHPLDVGLELGGPAPMHAGLDGRRPTRGVLVNGERTELPDVVFTRMGAASPQAGLHVLLQLEALGVPVINAPLPLWRARDKVRSFQVLDAAGVPTPASVVLGRQLSAAALERALGAPPWVLKAPEGTKGEAVFLVQDAAGLAALPADGAVPYVAQRFVPEARGADVRVMVVDGQARGAMRRHARGGDFRANLALGGRAEAVDLDAGAEGLALAELAVRACAAHGLVVAGVDLLESADGPLVIEVNGSPGFAGIEDATGLDLAGQVVELLTELLAARAS